MDFSAYQPKSSFQKGGFSKPNNSNSNHDMAKIFVGGLSWQTTEETLRYHFEQYGEVVSVEVMRDRVTGDPRGFAFVVFQDDATVDLVMSNLPHEINHKVTDVKRAQARGKAPPSIHKDGDTDGAGADNSTGATSGHYGRSNMNTGNGASISTTSNNNNDTPNRDLTPEQLQNKIFIGGLPLHLTKEGLLQFFTQFGAIADGIIMMDIAQQRSRGFGFVTFENGTGGAQKTLNAQPVYIDGKYVEIKLATPKGDQHGGGSGGGGGGGGAKRYANHSSGLRNASATAYQSKGEFASLAASYGRSGWRAGYGTIAFGSYGWNVAGWEDISQPPECSGFSFDLVEKAKKAKKRRSDDASSGNKHRTSKRQRQ
jgi:RNA-binding protein Musashi